MQGPKRRAAATISTKLLEATGFAALALAVADEP